MLFFSPSDFARVIFFPLFIPPQKNSGKIKLPSGLQDMESFLSFLKGAREHYCNMSIPSLNSLLPSLVVENYIDAHLRSLHEKKQGKRTIIFGGRTQNQLSRVENRREGKEIN